MRFSYTLMQPPASGKVNNLSKMSCFTRLVCSVDGAWFSNLNWFRVALFKRVVLFKSVVFGIGTDSKCILIFRSVPFLLPGLSVKALILQRYGLEFSIYLLVRIFPVAGFAHRSIKPSRVRTLITPLESSLYLFRFEAFLAT